MVDHKHICSEGFWAEQDKAILSFNLLLQASGLRSARHEAFCLDLDCPTRRSAMLNHCDPDTLSEQVYNAVVGDVKAALTAYLGEQPLDEQPDGACQEAYLPRSWGKTET